MLNECLKNDQSQTVEIVDCNARIGNTGMPNENSVNLGPKRLAKQRIQRMRRRHDRALITAKSGIGWTARMI